MKLSKFLSSRVFTLATVTTFGVLLSQACINNDPVPDEGTTTTNGTTMTGVTTAATAGSTDSTTTDPTTTTDSTTGTTENGGGSTECDNGANFTAYVPQQITTLCETANVPNCNITDFTAASYDSASGSWGDDMSLTGETFDYTDSTGSTQVHSIVDDALQITATVEGDGYTGVGLSFGPCVDASDFDGLQITMSGDLDEGGIFDLQLQTDENYPLGEKDDLGTCTPADPDSPWDSCTNNHIGLSGFTAETAVTFYIPWTELVGGSPNAVLDQRQLRAVQLQTGCDVDKAPCAINLQIHDVRFYRDHDPILGVGGAAAM